MYHVALPPNLEIASFVLDAGALTAVPSLCLEYFKGQRPWLVADDNTWKAAGKTLFGILRDAGLNPLTPYIFPAQPRLHADNRHVEELLAAIPADAVAIAVGGGTINDLVKRMSFLAERRYLCVPTGASVDGFTSSGAALVKDSRKQTLPCPAPLVVVADTDILKAAPPEMAASGYADLMAKIPAGADWMIVDSLDLEPIRPDVWQLVQPPLRDWLSDPTDMHKIFLGLATTGYAMQMYQDSRPASGAEHLASHIWEMEGNEASHGFKVGIGTMATTAMMTEAFKIPASQLNSLATPPLTRQEREQEIATLTQRGIYGDVCTVAMNKFLCGEALLNRRALIISKWEEMGQRVAKQLIPCDELKQRFLKAGSPVHYSEIGLSWDEFRGGLIRAQLIRKRYTILDLAYEAGILELVVDRIKPYFEQ